METIVVGGKRIRVHRQGAGRPIVYFHSATGEVGPLDFFDLLADAGYEVIVPELAGFGASDGAPEWRGIEDVVFHLRQTLDVLGLDKAIIIGTSLGGWLAAELAVWFPERVERLILIDAAGLKVDGAPVYSVFPAPGWDLGEMMRRSNPHNVDFMPLLARINEGVDADEATLRGLRGMEVLARLGWNPYLSDPKLPARLTGLAIPTLVLWGAEDELVPMAHGETYAKLIPQARLQVIARSGHVPVLEQPAETVAAITAFLG